MGRLMDRLPLPSKVPVVLVCHRFNANATLVLCNSIHEPPAVPFVTDSDSAMPVRLIFAICGVGRGIFPTIIWPKPVLKVEPFCCVHEVGNLVG